MTLLRNVARVLRDEDGSIDSELLIPAVGATAFAASALLFFVTGSAALGLAAAALAIPAQLVALAYRRSAFVVAGLGSLLTGVALALLTGIFARAFVPTDWAAGLIGAALGLIAAFVVGRSFHQAIEKLNGPGWY